MWGKRSRAVTLLVGLLAFALVFSACGGSDSDSNGSDAGSGSKSEASPDPVKLKVAISPYQDVNTLFVGIEQGFYEEAGIELEIVKTGWAAAQELLIGNQVDLANISDGDVVLQNAQGHDTTLAFPIFLFSAGALMFDPEKHDWKTYESFAEAAGGDGPEAVKKTLEQIKGKKIGVSAAGNEYATFVGLVRYAGLNLKDYEIVDIDSEDLPPALFSGSIDLAIGGIPQRLAAIREGYEALIGQTALPGGVHHGGLGAHRSWLEENPELASKLQGVIIKTLDYIAQNPDEAFPAISEVLKESGTEISTEELKTVWNKIEFFPDSKEYYEEHIFSPEGKFYWKDRFDLVVGELTKAGKIKELEVPMEDLYKAEEIIGSL
jgi:ABC-type nitrate/sulfonate/bicarbonate transport system substrate-binding protein